ncbi:hypothetical protein N7466_008574 [Penicillium verhagenii]|uniref:uncharacterized protein n=1 Tax=Penicillium verhagenii TaxID=1562060 RepID=UPI0025452420|nr:uncharacterized protein N7466_008574 [Penicillium verhagenii]KAJ5924387.1 hypothetical protein N7466_008574 [Penicillium verhagenii]
MAYEHPALEGCTNQLADTEAALYGAVATLREMRIRPSALVEASAKAEGQRQKSGRMEEWAQYPLQDWTGIEHWMAAVSDQFTVERQPIDPIGEPHGQMDQFVASRNSSIARSAADTESAYTGQLPGDNDIHIRPERMNLPGASQHTSMVGSDGVAASGSVGHTGMVGANRGDQAKVTERSRAAELSTSKSDIYF